MGNESALFYTLSQYAHTRFLISMKFSVYVGDTCSTLSKPNSAKLSKYIDCMIGIDENAECLCHV